MLWLEMGSMGRALTRFYDAQFFGYWVSGQTFVNSKTNEERHLSACFYLERGETVCCYGWDVNPEAFAAQANALSGAPKALLLEAAYRDEEKPDYVKKEAEAIRQEMQQMKADALARMDKKAQRESVINTLRFGEGWEERAKAAIRKRWPNEKWLWK